MPGLPIYQLDAFAEAPFSGNPAAVVPLEAWLPDEVLQAIAAENNLSETAFLATAADDPAHDFALRWFTPEIEVDLCGHATLAAGAALFERMGFSGERVRFSSRSGTLAVARAPGGRYELDFPARPGAPAEIPDGLAEALGGIAPVAFVVADKNMAVLSDEAAVRAVRPDLGFIANLPGDGLIVTAPAASGGDCASRYFAPHAGIAEDPVTGSAHCTIVPYWAARLGQSELHCRQLSARGGDLYCRLDGDRVRIAGRARLYLEGRIFLAAP
jgi:PhzF family phenazine biosynthesis protein